MRTASMLRKTCILAMASVFFTVSIQTPVSAAMVDNHQLAIQAELQSQRDQVRAFLARDDVRDAMLGYGIAARDIDTRIDNMSEAELLQIHDRLAELPAGGDGGVLEAVLIVILIFIMLDLLGATDVFPRI
jgi:hypothetical protein